MTMNHGKLEDEDSERGIQEPPEARVAYDAFNVIWSKVARSVRAETDNQARMRVVRAFFDHELAVEAERAEEEKRTRVAQEALGAVATSLTRAERPLPEQSSGPSLETKADARDTGASEPEEPPSMLHVALRVLRTLSRPEWEMAKAFVDLHKLDREDLFEVLNELQESHCPDCGAWLDDDDEHDDCPATDATDGSTSNADAVVLSQMQPSLTRAERPLPEQSSGPSLGIMPTPNADGAVLSQMRTAALDPSDPLRSGNDDGSST